MTRILTATLFALIFLANCDKKTPDPISERCEASAVIQEITNRNFHMGFSTWSFGPNPQDRDDTYQYVFANSDIYSEQIDNKVPWDAWINDTVLPKDFTDDIDFRVSKKPMNQKLLLSVSLLNTDRSDLLEDYDGSRPDYTALNDEKIENAYYAHLDFLVSRFSPDYFVIAMEVNELRLHSDSKWESYKLLMTKIRQRLKAAHPNLSLSESVTLHNWYKPEVEEKEAFIKEITDYVNGASDFAAISYYPFFKGQHTSAEFQQAFDFLHAQTTIPIAFVETNHLAENLEIKGFNLNIKSDVCEQKFYLETLLLNAYQEDYEFVIWWAHRDFDALWKTFPVEFQDIGKLWRDTGLLDESGVERPAFRVWKEVFDR